MLSGPWVGAAVLLTAAALYRPLYYAFVKEDRVLEWLQFFLFAAAAGYGLLAARRYRSSDKLASALFLTYGLALVFVAGEEISWGQRVLHITTPASLESANRQNELNLHNIASGVPVEQAFIWAQLVIGLLGASLCASSWLTRRHPRGRFTHLALPTPELFSTFAVLFAFRLTRELYQDDQNEVYWRFAEWPETCFALALFTHAFLAARRARNEARVEAECAGSALTNVRDPQGRVASAQSSGEIVCSTENRAQPREEQPCHGRSRVREQHGGGCARHPGFGAHLLSAEKKEIGDSYSDHWLRKSGPHHESPTSDLVQRRGFVEAEDERTRSDGHPGEPTPSGARASCEGAEQPSQD
ncbi:hypothetical protein [Modestobacter sp. VKM Ac-2984]|uniref:hypothetical protein n=1 Tax=Modestobacter sp. VKM Ac-2984 TaxID=3004138 RepID=UPI0022AAA58C|nr:hypothetical protein [Modestobacter sp. VKM Ac-2984]